MLYSFFSMLLSIGIWLYTAYQAKILGSPLISVDSLEWFIDSVLYMGGFLVFGAVWLFDKESQTIWARYLDPALLVLLSMILAVMPLKVFIKNLADLVMVAPKDMDDKIDTLLQNIDEMDLIRDEIEQGLDIPSYKIWLSVSFTKNPKWL